MIKNTVNEMSENRFIRNRAILGSDITYFKNLYYCICDAKEASQISDAGPSDPINYRNLCERLQSCRLKLPPTYRKEVCEPYSKSLEDLDEDGFNQVLLRDPQREGDACLMLDIAQAILQHGEDYNKIATSALQEVVSDLYDGFLSYEDRHDVKLPDLKTIAPLVKWGNPDSGPYTWPVDITANFGINSAIINFPPANSRCGLLAWAALSHETVGHDVIRANEGLRQELSDCLWNALSQANLSSQIIEYWASRIDETASDVLGILNMGPVVGIALLGYFRGLNFAWTGKPILRNVAAIDDPHPVDILRGYLAASVARLLNFSKADLWSMALEAESDKDFSQIKLGDYIVELSDAKLSANIVAFCLVNTKMKRLENHSLGEIQNWSNEDENTVNNLRSILKERGPLPEPYGKGFYAAHVVAAAVLEGLIGDTGIPSIFTRMMEILKLMHDKNPSWGPLYIKHPGNVVPNRVYINT